MRKFINKLFPDVPNQGYHISTYLGLDEEFKSPMYGKTTKDWNVAKEFLYAYVEAGFNCKIYNYESTNRNEGIVFAKNFNELLDIEAIIEWRN